MRLIDADLLKEKIRKAELNLSDCEGCYMASPECCRNCFEQEIEGIIYESYVLDAEPVRHGRWEKIEKCEYYYIGCSVCKAPSQRNEYGYNSYSDYCPHCGAKMDLGDDEN